MKNNGDEFEKSIGNSLNDKVSSPLHYFLNTAARLSLNNPLRLSLLFSYAFVITNYQLKL